MSVLRPLGHRIHVKPDQPVVATEGGIVIPDAYADTPPMSGTVIALGNGPERDLNYERRIRARAIRDCIQAVTDADEQFRHPPTTQMILDNLGRMLRFDPPDPGLSYDVQIGDRVIFPMESGHEIVFGERTEDTTIILTEESLLGVIEQEKEQVA